jgi:hypothetical protein
MRGAAGGGRREVDVQKEESFDGSFADSRNDV